MSFVHCYISESAGLVEGRLAQMVTIMMNESTPDRSHANWIWDGPKGVALYPILDDPPGTDAICVFGPDSIHPHEGFGWWKSKPKESFDQISTARAEIVGRAYSKIRESSMDLETATELARTVHKFPCFLICKSRQELYDAFDFWAALGGCPIGVSDSDIFLLADAVVTTFTQDYGDIEEMWGDG